MNSKYFERGSILSTPQLGRTEGPVVPFPSALVFRAPGSQGGLLGRDAMVQNPQRLELIWASKTAWDGIWCGD